MTYFINQNNCTGCKDCIEVCMEGAMINMLDELYIDPKWCTMCGACAALCSENAIQCEGLASEENFIPANVITESTNLILVEEIF